MKSSNTWTRAMLFARRTWQKKLPTKWVQPVLVFQQVPRSWNWKDFDDSETQRWIVNQMGLSENVGYIPNEIAIFHRDNDH